MHKPGGLALDYRGNALYWCDQQPDIIHRLDLTTLVARPFENDITDCTSLTVWNGSVYWSDVRDAYVSGYA